VPPGLAYLRRLGLVSEREARVLVDPVERLVAEFVEYLARERGLAVSSITVYEYERTARLFLSGLGLRACEVARLELGGVDWRAGELVVRGKQDRHERVPLPSDVGDALVDYLLHGRRDRQDPHLFLKSRAPYGRLTGGDGAIGMLVRTAFKRAGLPEVGVHRLRHTVATEALRAGAPLEEIASLMRHRRHATTVLYAKVDWERLRELARPWPGSRS
jgi:integrase/recombinase XerD